MNVPMNYNGYVVYGESCGKVLPFGIVTDGYRRKAITINGYFKIGMSNDPNYRERTLQSEKPSIQLIACKQYPSRAIALAIEAALHKAYISKNVRGEWFVLDENDVEDIVATLS